MLEFFGKLAKGKATWTGIAVFALSAIGKQEIAQKVVPVADAVLNVGMSVGALTAAAGWGRKTGYAAAAPKVGRR